MAATVAACGSGADSSQDPQTGENTVAQDDVPIIELPARWAIANARDVRTLVLTTDAVFVGEVIALSGQREERLGPDEDDGATGGNDSGKPAARGPAVFPVSMFDVAVERSLVGELVEGSTVVLEQPGGVTTRADGSQATILLEGDERLEVGARYLFFASVKPGGAVASAPFARFMIAGDGSIAPPAAWANLPAAQQLAGLSVQEAADEVWAAAH